MTTDSSGPMIRRRTAADFKVRGKKEEIEAVRGRLRSAPRDLWGPRTTGRQAHHAAYARALCRDDGEATVAGPTSGANRRMPRTIGYVRKAVSPTLPRPAAAS